MWRLKKCCSLPHVSLLSWSYSFTIMSRTSEYFFTSFSARCGDVARGGSPKSEPLCPTFTECLPWFCVVKSTIDSTAYSMSLNSFVYVQNNASHPIRLGFEPSTSSRLRARAKINDPPGPTIKFLTFCIFQRGKTNWLYFTTGIHRSRELRCNQACVWCHADGGLTLQTDSQPMVRC